MRVMPTLRALLGVVLLQGLLSGCAHEAGEAQAPLPGWAAGWVLPASSNYEFPPKTLPRKPGPAALVLSHTGIGAFIGVVFLYDLLQRRQGP